MILSWDEFGTPAWKVKSAAFGELASEEGVLNSWSV